MSTLNYTPDPQGYAERQQVGTVAGNPIASQNPTQYIVTTGAFQDTIKVFKDGRKLIQRIDTGSPKIIYPESDISQNATYTTYTYLSFP